MKVFQMRKKINKKILEDWCSIAANISQVLLLFLAIFGYFYTVMPVYQKELLSEKISQYELKLNEIEKLNEIQKNNLMIHEQELNKLKNQINNANQEILNKTKILNNTNIKINLLHKKRYSEALMIALLNRNVSIEDENNKLLENSKTEDIEQNLSKFVLTAYQLLKNVVDNPWEIYGDGTSVPQQITKSVNNDLSKIIEKNKTELTTSLANKGDLLYRIKHKQLKENELDGFDEDYYYQWSLSDRKRILYIINLINSKERIRALDFIEEFSNSYIGS